MFTDEAFEGECMRAALFIIYFNSSHLTLNKIRKQWTHLYSRLPSDPSFLLGVQLDHNSGKD